MKTTNMIEDKENDGFSRWIVDDQQNIFVGFFHVFPAANQIARTRHVLSTP